MSATRKMSTLSVRRHGTFFLNIISTSTMTTTIDLTADNTSNQITPDVVDLCSSSSESSSDEELEQLCNSLVVNEKFSGKF